MNIIKLINAYAICTCGAVCSRNCTVCSSTTWSKGPCVQQLWRQHIESAVGREAAERFNEMMQSDDKFTATTMQIGQPVPLGEVMARIPYSRDPITADPPVLSDEQIVERTIDFAEQLGMYMEPWQAAALRAILLHGGDVAVTRGGRGY
jgi:hypothetical protein